MSAVFNWLRRLPERFVSADVLERKLGFNPSFIDEVGRGARICTCPGGRQLSSHCPVHRDYIKRAGL